MKEIESISRQQTGTTVHDAVHTDSELYKTATVITAAFAGTVGIWGVICLSSAFLSEGPVVLIKSLFGAISVSM